MTNKEKKELQCVEKKSIEKSSGEPTRENLLFIPEVDIFENSNAITLRADLPGVKKEQLTIDVHDGILTLSAGVDPIADNHHLIYREYDVGGYSRKFTLGERIDQTKIKATIDNGVLTLVLPKAESAKPRKIEISEN